MRLIAAETVGVGLHDFTGLKKQQPDLSVGMRETNASAPSSAARSLGMTTFGSIGSAPASARHSAVGFLQP
jgi:hypothetical protein